MRVPAGVSASRAPQVYFLTPDYDRPAGGIRVIYRHVDILNEAGIPAFVVHQQRGFACTWFEHQTQLTDVKAVRLTSRDLLVVSELDVDLLGRLAPDVRHVILNQNSHLTWQRGTEWARRQYTNAGGLVGVITVSAHNQRCCNMPLEISTLPGCTFRSIPRCSFPQLRRPRH